MASDSGEPSASFKHAINNLQGQLKKSFLNAYPHHTVPGYNICKNPNVENYDEDNLIMGLFKEFPYSSDLPKPLLPPARLPQCVLKNQDPALMLLAVKSKIKDRIKRITEYHEKRRRDLAVVRKKNVKWEEKDDHTKQTTIPKYVAELASILESDPDPDFEGEYNWYCTGGSLDQIILSDRHILLFPYANELVATPIVEKSKSLWKPDLSMAAKCAIKSPVQEIRHSVTAGNVGKILTRQKYSCRFYTLSTMKGKLELEEIHRQQSDSPYVSADLNPVSLNKYCLVNSERSVELWDLNRMKYVSSTSMPKSSSITDNWASVRFNQSDPNLVTFVDRCCLHYIDLRTPLDGPTLTLCPEYNLELCEKLSLNDASKHNPFFQYLGTYHSLLLCDSRFGKSSVVQKWTHQFKSAPLFSGIVLRNEEEIITLSSQLSGESTMIINNWTSDTDMHSHSLPFMPLSISETLRACRDKGMCLDPTIKTRVELCNAGTTLNVTDTNDVTFFTQNSIGDIFYQCITHEKMSESIAETNHRSLLAMDAWEEACLKQRKTVKPLVISEKADMTHILNEMTNTGLRLESYEPKAREFEPRWFQSMEKLSSYIDILAPELLSVWDVRQDSVPYSITPHQKVLSWLEKKTSSQNLTQSQDPTLSQGDMFNESNEGYNSQELISVSQNINSSFALNDSLTEKIINDAPAPVTRKTRTAKKRKFVAGF
ncbi:uncharacterized protein LOC105686480 [Athalia rosae]|uniref:uncharacterized protein LOC105686480 n=1 Tax=Athalia rosae TaxID=37344 RepID=UPI0020348C3C|nr:uncharacterized protein LOC105686480 [Athalia rosae]